MTVKVWLPHELLMHWPMRPHILALACGKMPELVLVSGHSGLLGDGMEHHRVEQRDIWSCTTREVEDVTCPDCIEKIAEDVERVLERQMLVEMLTP